MQEKTNCTYPSWVLWTVILISFLALGAWWDGDKSKKETRQKQEVPAPKAPQKAKPQESKEAAEKTAKKMLSPEEERAEIDRIQSDLKQIIDRTEQLQSQVRENRAEIQAILERARIHERILRTIQVPQPIRTRQQINPDEILKQEKLRLIADQARRTQEQLRVIQQARVVQSADLVPPEAKPSKAT